MFIRFLSGRFEGSSIAKNDVDTETEDGGDIVEPVSNRPSECTCSPQARCRRSADCLQILFNYGSSADEADTDDNAFNDACVSAPRYGDQSEGRMPPLRSSCSRFHPMGSANA